MNDNYLGELHLLANTFFVGRYFMQIRCSDDILYSTLCKYIILSYIEDLWLTIVDVRTRFRNEP